MTETLTNQLRYCKQFDYYANLMFRNKVLSHTNYLYQFNIYIYIDIFKFYYLYLNKNICYVMGKLSIDS